MVAIASFSVAQENGNANTLADPENLYIGLPGFRGIMKKNKSKKNINHQVAAGGKLKIYSGHL